MELDKTDMDVARVVFFAYTDPCPSWTRGVFELAIRAITTGSILRHPNGYGRTFHAALQAVIEARKE